MSSSWRKGVAELFINLQPLKDVTSQLYLRFCYSTFSWLCTLLANYDTIIITTEKQKTKILPIVSFHENYQLPPPTTVESENKFTVHIFWVRSLWPLLRVGTRVQLKCDGTRWCKGGEVKGKLTNGVDSQHPSHYLRTWCIEHYYRWCTHLGCQ